MTTIQIQVIFEANSDREGFSEGIDLPNVPRIGEALFYHERDYCSVWIVKKVAYQVGGKNAACPCIEVSQFEVDEAPSGYYDEMIAGS